MQTIDDIAAAIVAREGGFVHDPDDPGGATKYGVTLATLRGLAHDVNRDGRVDVADVKALTREEARRIFIEHYFLKPRLDLLPAVLHASTFDMQVNAGANGVRILQRLATRMGFACADDGVVGPKTVAAVAAACEAAPEHVADAYGIARRNYYYALADARPASRKFARRQDGGKGGWILRAESFISARYHLTESEHRERTASWG